MEQEILATPIIKEISNKSLLNLTYLNYLTSSIHENQKKYFPLNNNEQSYDKIYPLWVKNELIPYEDKICDKLISSFKHNEKGTFNCMKWSPNGKKFITGLSSGPSGEILIINGTTFMKETVRPIKTENAVRSLNFTHDERLIICGDNKGKLTYFDTNLKEMDKSTNEYEPFKEISISPTDQKFVTCSEDKTLKIWDLPRKIIEKELSGHGNDITSCEWHPFQSLVASGSKDHSIKLWCPRSGEELATIRKHKNNVNKIRWNKNGNWLLSCSKDQLCKLFDIRKIEEEVQSYKNTFNLETNAICWNPIDERFFASADLEGNIFYWQVEENTPIYSCCKGGTPKMTLFDLAWNSLGHVLAGLGKDRRIDFWGVNKIGKSMFSMKTENLIAEPVRQFNSFNPQNNYHY